jgi:hypothetical protein
MKRILLCCLSVIALLLTSGCGTIQIGMLDALKSDDIPHNAINLRWALMTTNNPPVKALQQALRSDDYQQRHLAADILRGIEWHQPTDRLLEVTVEGLGDDQFPLERTPHYEAVVFLFNARAGVTYLVKHGAKAKKYLLKGIHSDDLQMQYLCAYLLGVHGIQKDIKLTSSILIRHLRDNDISGDAAAACSALYRLGDKVIPYLKDALPSDDEQQTELVTLVFKNLTNAPLNRQERGWGGRNARISSQHRDPAINLTYPDFYFPSGQDALRRAIFTPSKNRY